MRTPSLEWQELPSADMSPFRKRVHPPIVLRLGLAKKHVCPYHRIILSELKLLAAQFGVLGCGVEVARTRGRHKLDDGSHENLPFIASLFLAGAREHSLDTKFADRP